MSDEEVIQQGEAQVNKGRLTTRALATRQKRGKGRPKAEDTEMTTPVIEQYLAEGLSDSEIGKLMGIDRKAVANIRKNTARKVHKNAFGKMPLPERNRAVAEMMRLYGEGLTYVQIAEQLGLSYQSVRAKLTHAYAEYLETIKDTVAGRQYADIQMMKEELLEIIVRDYHEELEQLKEESDEPIDELDSNAFRSLIQKAYEKGRKNTDTKFKAMEVFLKLLDREAKIFGIDAASQVNVNHTVRVEPESIMLLRRIEERQNETIVEAEVIEELDLGNL